MSERTHNVHVNPESLSSTLDEEREGMKVRVERYDREAGRGAKEKRVAVTGERNPDTGRYEILVVDPGSVSMLRRVEEGVLNTAHEWDPDHPPRFDVYLTHPHPDHLGKEVIDRFEQKRVLNNVYASAMTVEKGDTVESLDPKELMTAENAAVLQQFGREVLAAMVPAGGLLMRLSDKQTSLVVPAVMGEVLRYAYGRQHGLETDRITPAREGEKVHEWTVTDTPGHTDDETMLHKKGMAIGGDLLTVLRDHSADFILSLNLLSTGASLDHALDSVRKIHDTVTANDIDRYIGQHGPVVRGRGEIEGRLTRVLRNYENYRDDARRHLGERPGDSLRGEDLGKFYTYLKSKNVVLGGNATEEMMVVFHILRAAQEHA